MATGTAEKLTFLRNNERVVAVTESTEQHYEHCANDLNFTHSQSDRHRKEELCETINNLLRQIGHEERLELHLQDSDWRFTIVKVEVIPQAEEERNGDNDFVSQSPSPRHHHSPLPHLPVHVLRPRRHRPNYREAGQSSQPRRTSGRSSTRLSRPTPDATNSPPVTVSPHRNSPVRTTTETSSEQRNENNDFGYQSPSPQHHRSPLRRSPIHALRPRRNHHEASQSSQPQPTHRHSRPAPPPPQKKKAVRSSMRSSRPTTDATNSPPHRNSHICTTTETYSERESSNMTRTCEDIRSEIAKIEGDLNDMLLKLKDEKKKIFVSRNDWRSIACIVAAIQIVLTEIPLSVNPICLQQFQGQLDEQVGKLLNTEMHCEWSVELFVQLTFVFENISDFVICGNAASFYVSGRNSKIQTSDAEEAVMKIMEARSHKARLVNELDEMQNRDGN